MIQEIIKIKSNKTKIKSHICTKQVQQIFQSAWNHFQRKLIRIKKNIYPKCETVSKIAKEV